MLVDYERISLSHTLALAARQCLRENNSVSTSMYDHEYVLQRFFMGPRVSREGLGVVIDGDNASSTRR